MEKKILKEVLFNLEPGMEIEVSFYQEMKFLNGKYFVVSKRATPGKVGPDKKGSWVASLQPLFDNTLPVQSIHTKDNEKILSVSINNTVYGSKSEFDPSRRFPTDETTGFQRTNFFKTLKEGQRVEISSDLEPMFNGLFFVVSVKAKAGRFGQVVLTLLNELTKETFEVWSQKHSLALKNIKLI